MLSDEAVDPAIYLEGMKFIRWAVEQDEGEPQDLSE